MNRYLKVVFVVMLSAVIFFLLARAYFESQMESEIRQMRSTLGGNTFQYEQLLRSTEYARREQMLRSAGRAAVTAQALDCTLVYIIVALIGGIWWARR